MLILILTYALFASAFSFNKAILEISSPIFLAGVRTIVSGIILSSYSFINKQHKTFKKSDIYYLIQIAFLCVFLHSILKNYALKDMTSIKTGFFHNLDPFISALYAYMLFSEKLTPKRWLGMIVAFLGAIVYLISTSSTEKLIGTSWLSIQELAIILSIAVNRLGWFKIQYLVRDKKYSSSLVIGISMIIGGVLALLTSFFIETGPYIIDMRKFLLYLTYIIISSNIIGYNLYAHLHKVHSATLITLVGFSQPLFVALYGTLFLGESISSYYIISMLLVFTGVGIFYNDEIRKLD